jgi:hypothetical protein
MKQLCCAAYWYWLCLLIPTTIHAQPQMRDFIGINVKTQLPYERMTRMGNVRSYHRWPQGSSGSHRNLSCNNNRYTHYDDFYGIMPQRTVAVLQSNAPITHNNADTLFNQAIRRTYNDTPLSISANSFADPDRWLATTVHASLFAARCGTPLPGGYPVGFEQIAAQYVTAPDNTGLGRGSVGYIEVFNEPDAAWHQSDQVSVNVTGAAMETDPDTYTKYYFRPDQYAAMLSAVYDGHINSNTYNLLNLNNQVVGRWGIRNFSPKTRVVLAGTADLRYDYLYFLKQWKDQNLVVVTRCASCAAF